MSATALREAAGAAPATNQKPKDIASLMSSPQVKAQMALALPKHMTADRLMRIALTEIRKVPKLATCETQSFMGAVMQCAQLGLEPGAALGHAYLLPFDVRKKVGNQWQTVRTDCQLIIGYRGMIDLARRSDQIISLSARSVHKNDEFSYSYGLSEDLHHVPASGDRGDLTHVYAVARLKGGGVQFEVMSRADVEKIKDQSKAGSNGPWVSHFDEMAKKTVIRRLFKYLPVSIEIQTAVSLDERAEAGIPQDNASALTGEYAVIPDDQIDQATGEIHQDQQQEQDEEQQEEPQQEQRKPNGGDTPRMD